MASVLGYPWPGKKFSIDMDASNTGMGGVLSQVQEGQEHVAAYYSRILSKAKRNYCVTQKELLAIVKTEYFHKYLLEQELYLCTNHPGLTWLLNFKNLDGEAAIWAQSLQEYNLTSKHH
jgi:hypothetical protein